MNNELIFVSNLLTLGINVLVTGIGVAVFVKLYTEILKNDNMSRRHTQAVNSTDIERQTNASLGRRPAEQKSATNIDIDLNGNVAKSDTRHIGPYAELAAIGTEGAKANGFKSSVEYGSPSDRGRNNNYHARNGRNNGKSDAARQGRR